MILMDDEEDGIMKRGEPMTDRNIKPKKARVLTAVMVMGIALLWSGWAAGEGITGSKHNLSSTGTNTVKGTTDEICIYCHTPHHADATLSGQGVPLWNRNIVAGGAVTYAMYSSPTFDATKDSAPSGVSRACLSCHDGTVGINQLLNRKGSGLGTNPSNATDTKETGVVLLGTDLRDDHPISMTYSTARSPNGSYTTSANNGNGSAPGGSNSGFNSTGYILGQGLKLFGGESAALDYVQCASCHDPHNAGNPTFLRINNTDSALCLTCHRKDGSSPL
jgi:predicted CXXCH cytochrome family protein